MTIASPRYCWNTLSISAVRIIAILPHTLGFGLAIEAVIFVAHEDSDRSLGLPGLFKGHRNPWRVGVVFHQVIIDPEGVDEALRVCGGGILGDAVPRPTPVADHEHDRDVQAQGPPPQRIA